MNIPTLLMDLDLKGVRFTIEGDRIVIDAPPGMVTPVVRTQLSEHKADVIAWLGRDHGDDAVDLGLTDVDRRTVEAIRSGDTYRLPSPGLPDPQIPDGWTRPAWIERLQQLADTCDPVRPDIAAEHRAETDRLCIECEPLDGHGGLNP